jgi:hypothetical protein
MNDSAIRTELLNCTPFHRDNYEKFVSALKYSGLASVDAFLEKREEFIDVGKSAIAIELLRKENREALWADNRNWMKYLFDQITTDKLDDFARNTVSIVGFGAPGKTCGKGNGQHSHNQSHCKPPCFARSSNNT